jgi:hypothetical protein
MTANRDLKRRVRDRQEQTGESYMTALQHVLAQRGDSIPSAIPTVEFIDVTEVAAALGLKCRITVSPELAHAIDVERTLERFRDALLATSRDPALLLMQTIALHGEHVYFPMAAGSGFQGVQDAVRFVDRVLAGLGGISHNGRTLALRAVPRGAPGQPPGSDRPGAAAAAAADEPYALFSPWSVPSLAVIDRPPLLVVNTVDELAPEAIRERFGGKVTP